MTTDKTDDLALPAHLKRTKGATKSTAAEVAADLDRLNKAAADATKGSKLRLGIPPAPGVDLGKLVEARKAKGKTKITKAAEASKAARKAAKAAKKTAKPKAKAKGKAKTPTPRADSKQARFIAAMKTAKGISITEAAEEFGWQPHTVRGAVAGALRVKLGLKIDAERDDKRGTVYRIK